MHGGRSPAALARGAERVLEAKVRKLVPDHVAPMANPLLSLLTVAAEASGTGFATPAPRVVSSSAPR